MTLRFTNRSWMRTVFRLSPGHKNVNIKTVPVGTYVFIPLYDNIELLRRNAKVALARRTAS